jgi:NADH-quinone oxidoreductase subunit N
MYGLSGTTNLRVMASAFVGQETDPRLVLAVILVVAGIGFKIAAVPFHMWAPDVYEGAPTPITAFLSVGSKAASFAMLIRIFVEGMPSMSADWRLLFYVLSILTMTAGNIAAVTQSNVKRMLAYSSISQAGFMLIPIAANNELGARALLFFLVPYCAMAVGSFAVVAARERELQAPVTLDSLSGMGWERPFLGVSMWVFMLGFAGFPLTGGFVAKFYALSAAYDRGWVWLMIVGVAATLVSLYYYLGVVRAMYFRDAAELQLAPAGGSPPRELVLGAAVAICLVVTVGSFFAVQPLIDVATSAARALPI